ncbi:Hypothetical protein R9X50_00692200 [Acrodontium crateriforme]|uniref:GPI ethanolamine phosphate transferase 3 n=1 Tax=Acrodontium crateriforme TaxID=150365 RepID=A0AAQ3MAZ3_9PEZI|nr:Hypothetical protein R9X50_00692200 [Acrodontium crateriforme]
MDKGASKDSGPKDLKAENKRLSVQFKAQHGLLVAFFALILIFHILGIYLFCSGFLLSRLVLTNRSECAHSPLELLEGGSASLYTAGSPEKGCWHPRTFDKAVVIVIDALRYDFTVPFLPRSTDEESHYYFHNALPVLYETATQNPNNAFLRPFIADPPTTTLQRLKGLTTGTLPTFIDAGSNFAGTAIDEDNLVEQLFLAGKKVVHLGDDTWHALFPGYFEPNLTKAYDSFNVWDLHTLDNGVNEHIFPLLEPSMQNRWDVIIGHYLGVDHAGHRYGPDHPAMNEKLKQMDGVLRKIMDGLDDDTVLVVMGDHGMDVKGDHGGESDDEVEAALFMYSKRGVFGRSKPEFKIPPATAKERPVGQIDIVPTLALLLGLPIPFNNLGKPIEEAFLQGSKGWQQLALATRLTSAQIHRYQGEYAKARKLDESNTAATASLWQAAGEVWQKSLSLSKSDAKNVYQAFMAYQVENLRICKNLWARFDLVGMGMGIALLVGTFIIVAMYAQGIQGDRTALSPVLLGRGLMGTLLGGGVGALLSTSGIGPFWQWTVFGAGLGGILFTLAGLSVDREILRIPLPSTFWGGLSFLVTILLCVGFASNSFTIWEDEQLLFLLTTFGLFMLASSLGQNSSEDRNLGVVHSVSFMVATRLSSFSRLCREEQMPDCMSTYYSSATSSTSASWQLIIPFLVALILPSVIRQVYVRSLNYQGSAVIWIGIVLRIGLTMTAIFWVLDAADDGEWYPNLPEGLLKTVRIYIAQILLALTFAAGYGTYIWSSVLLTVKEEQAEPASISKPLDEADPMSPVLTTTSSAPKTRSKLIILGYANTHGTRYFLLPCVWALALQLVQKPMGQGTLALCMVSILNVLEVVDANNLRRSPLGPIVLALLGSFYFFKTGHQAALATIQWETAFIPFRSIVYPWSPILVILNSFGPQILCAIAVPAISIWKVPPKLPGLLSRVAGALTTHILFYAAITLATVIEAAWLRRHLMLYRVFMPRMLVAIINLLLVEIFGAFVAVLGLRWSIVSVGDIFGWPGAIGT